MALSETISGLDERLYQILPAKPKKIFLMCGINDVSHDLTADSIVTLMGNLIQEYKLKAGNKRFIYEVCCQSTNHSDATNDCQEKQI